MHLVEYTGTRLVSVNILVGKRSFRLEADFWVDWYLGQ